jgi:dienelactone hydrolase
MLWVGELGWADETAQLKSALEKPILETAQPYKEIRAFIQPRILKFSPPADKAAWEQMAQRVRRDMLDQVVFRGAAAPWREAKCGTLWLDTIEGGPGYHIRKFRYEALPGMWIPGLLYVPDKLEGTVPLAINVNGHAAEGKAVGYKQLRSINLAKRGMLVLNVEWFGMGQLRTSGFAHGRMNQLDLCGASGLAPFYLALERAIDVAEKLEHADPKRIVVSGLSGGGWQTILISSLDTRVAVANPVAGYGSFHTNIAFDDMGDSEQSPTDMAMVADYAHLTALRAPRPTLLTYNASDDCCFKSGHTLGPLLEAARPVFALYGADDRLRSHVNHVPGNHNFEQDNRERFYELVGDSFFPGDKSFARTEIPSEAEIKTAEQLNVPLPDANIDFHRLASGLMKSLPGKPTAPSDPSAAETWRQQRREQLKALLRVPNYEAVASGETSDTTGPFRTTSRTLKIGSSWSVPAVELAPREGQPKKTVIAIADGGRAAIHDKILALADQGFRVLSVDPFLLGESKIKAQDPDYTYPLFLATVGERALGIQAAQLVAVARWARADNSPITLMTWGPRSSTAALVAAAIAPDDVAAAELNDSLASFKELIEQDKPVESLPELFAFGLLAEFDIGDIQSLVAPRSISIRPPSR